MNIGLEFPAIDCYSTSNDRCYVCRKFYDEIATRRHEEHIIQNAIGGKLTSDRILCEDCGGRLADLIDTPFSDELALFNILHGTSRDRDSRTNGVKIDVLTKVKPESLSGSTSYRLCEDYRVLPNRPIFFRNETEKTITIIASTTKQATDFSKSKPIQRLAGDGYKIQKEDDVGIYAEKCIYNFNPNSIAIIRGISKIALEFAIYSGIESRFLEDFIAHLLDASNSEGNQNLVIQYYPTTDEEKIYEVKKYEHEDWHPNHQITLFSDRSELYCYVELFGSIQKYVHLSSKYGGKKILTRFTQRVRSWNFNPSDWSGGPKDLHIFAGQFGIQYRGRRLEDIEKDVIHQARIRSYTLDPEIQINKVKHIMQALIHYTIANIKGTPTVDELLEKSVNADQTFGLSILRKLKDNPIDALKMIRKSYLHFRVKSNKDCCPTLARKIAPEILDQYSRFKLYESLCSVAKEQEIAIYEPHTNVDNYVNK
ncbi:HNH endonuclease [Pseudomonas sp. JBR1]|uniref:HNH endonuclease n=1 Tax=Pseudomonas sp. JBR1 TaxID=3020907 RepID=UPI002305D3FD|nr:HNH endonuclease [Pseudomonas sp. JBR1]WCE10545.1 HNH endonuclease [Pseudomonas sp. JBR1]